MSKTMKWITIIIIVLVLGNIIIWTNFFIIKYRYNYAPIECARIEYTPSNVPNFDLEREEAIALIDDLFGINYTLKWGDLKEDGILGHTVLILNIVTLDNTLTGWEILDTLTHELCHIKYYTSNETYTELMSFVELYESDNEILKNRAEWMIFEQCVLKVRNGTEYDASYYILEYLKTQN